MWYNVRHEHRHRQDSNGWWPRACRASGWPAPARSPSWKAPSPASLWPAPRGTVLTGFALWLGASPFDIGLLTCPARLRRPGPTAGPLLHRAVRPAQAADHVHRGGPAAALAARGASALPGTAAGRARGPSPAPGHGLLHAGRPGRRALALLDGRPGAEGHAGPLLWRPQSGAGRRGPGHGPALGRVSGPVEGPRRPGLHRMALSSPSWSESSAA